MVGEQPGLYAIDKLVRSSVQGDTQIDLHLRYAERAGEELRLVLALYNNGTEDLLAVPGLSLDQATLTGSAPATLVSRSADFEQGIVPEGGWLAGGASNGDLTFTNVEGSNLTFELPGFPPVMFRLDTPLRAAPEPLPSNIGQYLLGYEAQSDDMPGVRLVLQQVEVTADQLNLAVSQVVDPSVARTPGINFDGTAIFDARWNQYYPDEVEGSDAGAVLSADGLTETSPYVLHFPRPRTGDVILLRVAGFSLIRIPLRADDEPSWAETRDLPPSYQPRAASTTSQQPLTRTDDPASAFKYLVETLNQSLATGDLERYLDAFVPAARSEQAALFERLRTLPIEEVAFVPDGTSTGETEDSTGTFVGRVLWNYRVRDVEQHNLFSSPVELMMERDGDAWRFSAIQGSLPFWAIGATEVKRTERFWVFYRPDDRDALATVEQDVGAAFSRVSTLLPEYTAGPFVMFVTSTPDEFAAQTGRDPARFIGAALSRWSFQHDAISIASAAFYINGAVFHADPNLDRQQTITHELTHLVLAQQTMPFTPLWLVEGMAMHVSDDLPAAAMQEQRDSGAVDAWQLQEFTALRRFGEHDPAGQQTATEYAYSAYLVRYLIDTYGFERVVEFYTSFAQVDGASIVDDMAEATAPDMVEPLMSRLTLRLTASALKSTFDVDILTFEQDYKQWLANDGLPGNG